MPKILLGETQEDLASAIVDYFTLHKFEVRLESSGQKILECLNRSEYDVIILEIVLPGLDSIEIVTRFRTSGGITPVLLLANEYCSDQLKTGLDAGADGYVVKPFRLDELSARLRALLRRPNMKRDKVLVSGNVTLNTESGVVTRDNQVIHLHPMEFKLLQFLLRHPNQIFSTHAIFERVWRKDGNLEDTVRTHIRTLRMKIDSPGEKSIVTTVRGFGYKAEIRHYG